MRPLFLLACWGLLLAVGPGVGGAIGQEAPAGRPNLIVVFTDDHAAHALGAYGGRLAALDPTPNLDRLAAEGMLFRNAFVTNAICAPSRAVLLTGRHSHQNGVLTNAERFDSSQVTFPKLLQEAGYQTALVGKWHLKSEPTGFDHWAVLPGQGRYYNPDFRTPEGVVRDTGYATDVTTDRALRWLREARDPDRPFLLMLQHKAPHRPWEPSPDHLTLYDDEEIPEPPTLFDDYRSRTGATRQQAMSIARHLYPHYDLKVPADTASGNPWIDRYPALLMERMTPAQRAAWQAAYGPKNEAFRAAHLEGAALTRWKYQRYIKDYLRTVASVDDNFGRLLDYLKASGLAERTVVVYTSDQGFFLGEHGWYDKRWMYEESLRIPLLVRWPGVVAPGAVNTDLVQNLDLAPTFLAMAGAPVPPWMQGRSLTPLLRGTTPADWREGVYYHYYEAPSEHVVPRHEGVRTHRYKLIHYYDRAEWELFDLARDPHELQNIYADPAYGEVRERLREKLAALRARYDVPAPPPLREDD